MLLALTSVPAAGGVIQVTGTPGVGFPYWSVARKSSESGSALPAAPLCVPPETMVTVVGAPATDVA